MERVVIVIVGPTCSGKTILSIRIAQRIPSEIISADSRQIYKFLNIGTAKPSNDQLQNFPHHLIDKLNPDEDYNASIFAKDAELFITNIFGRHKVPIVVGGSGLYIRAFIDGIFDTDVKDLAYRKELIQMRRAFGNEYIYEMLKKNDPESATKMLPQNWKRVIRALEVLHTTGHPIWKHHNDQTSKTGIDMGYSIKQFGINWDRKLLYENIDKRVDKMILNGFVDEVKKILNMGYDQNLNSLNTVGYKEIIEYLKGSITLERTIELIKRNTRHYAKRQMTWFRKDNRIQWFNISDINQLDQIADEIIQSIN